MKQYNLFAIKDEKNEILKRFCRRCGRDTENKITIMPVDFMHYARLDCLSCGKFNAWLPKPRQLEGK